MGRPIAGLTLTVGVTNLGELEVPITEVETVEDSTSVHVKGKVVSANSEYFVHFINTNLAVKIYRVFFSADSVELANIPVKSDGSFETNVAVGTNSIVLKVYINISGTFYELAVSQKYCRFDKVDGILLNVDESIAGPTIWAKVTDRLLKAGVPNTSGVITDTDLIHFTIDQIKELQTLTCVTEYTLRRFQTAYRLFKDLQNFTTNLYSSSTSGAIDSFKSNAAVARQIFFALLKGDFNISLGNLLAKSSSQFTALLQASKDKNEIDASIILEEIVILLVACRNAVLFNSLANDDYYDAKLIHLSSNLYANKSSLLNRALEGGGLPGLMPVTAGDSELEPMPPIMKLDGHLKHYPPFLAIAMANAAVGSDPNYYTLSLNPNTFWSNMMGTFPSAYASKTAYATAIYDSISEGQTSARFARGFTGSAYETAFDPDQNITAKLAANPTFSLTQQSVLNYFKVAATPGAANEVSADLLESMSKVQRSLRLSGDTDDLKATFALIGHDLHSSYSIVQTGPHAFGELMLGAGLSSSVSAGIYCRAVAMNSLLNMATTQYMAYESKKAIMPQVLTMSNFTSVEQVQNGMPDLEDLFGSLNSCTCEECQSIYSPAAYLTDLLYWIKRIPKIGGGTTLDVLESNGSSNRRRDIRFIELSCKNSNTLIPYIDLVNEILSVNLLPDTSPYPPSGKTFDDDLKKLKTTKTTEEVMAQPEHRFPTAEALLDTAYYQWALPYNVNFDEATTYLRELKKPYDILLNDFNSPVGRYNNSTWAYAYLNVGPAESILLDGSKSSDTAFWLKYWGFQSSDLTDIGPTPKAGPVMRTASLGITELKDILYTNFINPTSLVNVAPDGSSGEEALCDVDTYIFTPKFDATIADRFMRFLRLKRKTGLTSTELDYALKNYSTLEIDAAFMTSLASYLAFRDKYNLTFYEALVYMNSNVYDNLINAGQLSQYFKDTYQNPLLPADVIDFFTPGSTTQCFAISVNNLTYADKQKLSTVLKTTIPVIEAIKTHALGSNPVLSKATLSVFHRYSSFMKIFAIEAAELVDTMALLGDPLNTTLNPNTMKALWDFADKLAHFKTLNTKASDLKNILLGTGDYSSASLEAEAELVWNDIESAYKLAREANPSKEFASTTPYLPTDSADQLFFKDVIVDNLRLPFNINFEDVKSIVNHYPSATNTAPTAPLTWLRDYIADPFGLGNTGIRNWAYKKTSFMPGYQLLKRVALLSEILGLDADVISIGIDDKIRFTPFLPNDPFYWMSSYWASSNLVTDFNKFLWIKNASDQAIALDISLVDYIKRTTGWVNDYTANNASTYTSGTSTQISALYAALGVNSKYKKLSVFEFIQTFLRGKLISSTATDLVSVLLSVDSVFNASDALGIKVTDCWSWVWNSTWTSYVSIGNYKTDIRRVLQSRHPNTSDWNSFITPIQNNLRAKLRDALVALYVGQKGFKNENALYAYYLLDNQMAPCMKTSRIVQASASVQLLIFRALLDLEPDVDMSPDDKNEWEWRKAYRLWEANRKVFIYPENWIDPSLRRDKTFLFKEAEALLQQDEINQEHCEEAFAGYLTGLGEVAKLDIRAMYIETPDSTGTPDYDIDAQNNYVYDKTEIMHVFARTWNPPYVYYYRTLRNDLWSGWEKLDVEIDSDHLIPIMFRRKLYIFFPLFVKKLYNSDPAKPYYEIQMCYTKKDHGKWSSKKVLNGKLLAGSLVAPHLTNEESNLKYFTLSKDGAQSEWSGTTEHNATHYFYNGTTYALASMKIEDFYFWAELQSDGNLEINVRRALDPESSINPGFWYSDFAYERRFKIYVTDETVDIIEPYITESGTNRRHLGRPDYTQPFAQQIKWGVNKGDTSAPAKDMVSARLGHGPSSWCTPLIGNAQDYVLTYAHQFKHAKLHQPFFFANRKGSLFFRKLPTSNNYAAFYNEHPYVREMLTALNHRGVEGLLNSGDPTPSLMWQSLNDSTFPYTKLSYLVATTAIPLPKKSFDFSSTGPYSIYNWEVFFHSVSLISRQLKQSNKFAEAIKWLSYVFDPGNRDTYSYTDPQNSSNTITVKAVWQIKPFQEDHTKSIAHYIKLLSVPITSSSSQEAIAWNAQLDAWQDNPFDPHMIAALRPRAYMLWTVMEMIDTLTEWGDYLFRQDTLESINEAINLYVIASEILGTRPKNVDRPEPDPVSFDSIQGSLGPFANAMVTFETYMVNFTGCTCASNVDSSSSNCFTGSAAGGVLSSVTDLLFCIPPNPKLLAMWDKVEDRLYKIRHCMNIDGKIRELALFSPPIDPALLVRATAMGLSLSDVLSDLAAPPPHYRFSFLLQRANEFCNDVKSLGAQLLTVLEKKDSEELSQFRQHHEQNILAAARNAKQMAIDEAKQTYSTLEHSKQLIQIRLDDYKNRQYKNNRENSAIEQTRLAEGFMFAEQGVRVLAGLLNLIPDVFIGAPTATGAKVFGGSKLNKAINAGGHALNITSTVNRNKASMSLTYANYDRRQEEWNLQIKSATEELLQVDRQLLGAQIRIAVTEKELENHDLQVTQSQEMADWMKDKYTNDQLYSWMAGQVKGLYRKAYTIAYDMAKLAQQAFFRELGDDADTPKINFGHWDSSRAGFFAGERLSSQLRELEASYIKQNEREYELTKNISLALLDPASLEQLKATGTCDFLIPEALFSMDYPAHYYRRIKSVSISIPCIAGPHTNINATLSLTHAKVRTSGTDTTPIYNPVSIPVESIATSSAQNDSGVFELNFKDERYLPFEGKGAVSRWTLELSSVSSEVAQFDQSTIADVIVHMKYTSRDKGSAIKTIMKNAIKSGFNSTYQGLGLASQLHYAINLRHDMPNEWHQLKQNGNVNIKIDKARLPYFMQADTTLVLGTSPMVVVESSGAPAGGNVEFKVGTGTPVATVLSLITGSTNTYKGISGTAVAGMNFGVDLNIKTSPDYPTGNFDELVIIVLITL